jgi:quinoprotein glucose dehydrogenase
MPNFNTPVLFFIFAFTISPYLAAQEKDVDWSVYGGNKANTKYSPLNQINPNNLDKLKVAWSWDSVDNELKMSGDAQLRRSKFEVTPLVIDGVMYLTTSYSRIVALDPLNGETKWLYDPKHYEPKTSRGIGYLHRGPAYWTDGKEKRLFYGTMQAHLTSIDAETGIPDAAFGDNGSIDLTVVGLDRPAPRRVYSNTSPPLIVGDLLITGCWISDGATMTSMPRGDVRAFDVRTGDLLWTFHTIPQPGEFGNDTWEGDSWKYTGNTNAWSVLSADEELGYIYLPIGASTHNWYGGHRLGDNLYSGSIVCLEAKTGKRVWHYQMIHHDIWDYDVPAAPVLFDLTIDGKPRKAVAQIMKTGFCFVFDRVTGEPIWPIEDKPVPASHVEGERAAKTQPHPTKPPAFEPQGFSEENFIDYTPELFEEAKKMLAKYEIGPLFTPPSEKGTISNPGYGGGANWGGAAFDPDTGMLYIPSMTFPISIALGKGDPNRTNFDWIFTGETNLVGPQGLPLYKGPYGRLTAIDLTTGEQAWMVPNGSGPRDHAALKDLDLPPLGARGVKGILLTKGLIFIGGQGHMADATKDQEQPMLYVRDKTTGYLLREIPVPNNITASPMTYQINGTQYVTVATGVHGEPESLVTFALED